MNLPFANAPADASSVSVIDRRDAVSHLVVCLVVIAVAAALLIPLTMRGWIPHDEGTLAQSAHRVLLGQLPHRDFDDVYSGGLAFLHAGAFKVLGERLTTLRTVLLVFVLFSLPAFYYIASRFASPVPAGFATIALVGWSFTNYAASMPSWFNLLFAATGCAALMRWRETDRLRWLVLAGACAGLSIIVKIIGVYFVAAALLFLAYRAMSEATESAETRNSADVLFRAVVVCGIALASAIPFVMMRRAASLTQLINLAAPATVIGLFVATRAMQTADRRNVAKMLKHIATFSAGVAVPVLLFTIPYLKSGSVFSLYEGLFLLPRKRLTWAANGGPPPWGALLPIVWLALILLPRFADSRLGKIGLATYAVLCAAVVATASDNLRVYVLTWLSIAMATPAMVAIGLALLKRDELRKREGETAPIKRDLVFLLLATTAWCGLVQFPFSGPIYFCYVAPLVVLSAFAISSTFAPRSSRMGFVVLATYCVVGLLSRNEFFSQVVGRAIVHNERTAVLDLGRGGLVVRESDRAMYDALVKTIDAHASSKFIYVTTDAPEVYFLAERENPTRTLFDFFDDPVGREQRILRTLSTHDVHLVVLNSTGEFSGPVPKTLYDSLAARFPVSASIGNFEVRWNSRRPADLTGAGENVSQPPSTISASRHQ
jgi:hypothetical protein